MIRFNGQAYIGEQPVHEASLKSGDIITYRGKDGGEGIMEVDPATRKLIEPKRFQKFSVEIIGDEMRLIPVWN